MADKTHLKILSTGVKDWNKWREKNPEIIPDLSGANLKGVIINGIDLARADLTGNDLSQASLNGADFSMAILSGANLSGTNLSGANLSGTNLSGANLSGAELNETDLSGTDLGKTSIAFTTFKSTEALGTNFSGAILFRTQFSNMELSTAKGLDEVGHHGPSFIDISTIYRSKGKIPLSFLRGAGVPEIFIEYLPSLVGATFDYYSCFISYSTKDQAFAERLHADLQDKGVRCWFAPHDAKSGQKIDPQIDQAIRMHEKLLLILSADSIKSEWVIREIKKACKREAQENRQVLFPVSLVPFDQLREWEFWDNDLRKDLAAEIREYLIPDFSQWEQNAPYQKSFTKLLKDLKSGKTKA